MGLLVSGSRCFPLTCAVKKASFQGELWYGVAGNRHCCPHWESQTYPRDMDKSRGENTAQVLLSQLCTQEELPGTVPTEGMLLLINTTERLGKTLENFPKA